MFFIFLAVAFALLASIRKVRNVCIALCTLNTFLLFVTLLCDKNGDALYLLRAIGTTVCAISLCIPKTALGFYQAVIQLAILCGYAALAYDVSQGKHILIYNNYEMVIYGLVACQFAGIFTSLWDINWRGVTSRLRRNLHLQRN